MLTVLLILTATTLVFFAGEAVRNQCRRMLDTTTARRSVGQVVAEVAAEASTATAGVAA